MACYVFAKLRSDNSDKVRMDPKKVFVFGAFVNKAKHPSISLARHWRDRLQSRADKRGVGDLLVIWVKETDRDYAKSKDARIVFAGRMRTKAAFKLLFPHESAHESHPDEFDHGGEGGD